jgi:hypothetical protein
MKNTIALIVLMIVFFLFSGLFFLNSGMIDTRSGDLNEENTLKILEELDEIPFINLDIEEIKFDSYVGGKDDCLSYNGGWVEEFNECEMISKKECDSMKGEYFECESACRNDPEAEMCIMMCVQVCKFD